MADNSLPLSTLHKPPAPSGEQEVCVTGYATTAYAPRLNRGPVDGDAFALHAAEPCHLALCELVDGGGELRAHLL